MDRLSYTVPEALAVTGLGRTKLYELIGQGKLETIKIGTRTLVKGHSLRELVGA